MTNKSKLVADTILPAAPAASTIAPAVEPKPYVVRIVASTLVAFSQAAVHIRNGYIFSPDAAPEIFPALGQCNITLILGTPEQYAVDAAAATTAEALELQRYEYQKQVEAAARQMVDDAAKAEKAEKRAALIEEQKKQLAALEAQIAATA